MSPIGVMVTQVNYVNRQRVKDDAKRVTEVYKSLTPKIAVYGKASSCHPSASCG